MRLIGTRAFFWIQVAVAGALGALPAMLGGCAESAVIAAAGVTASFGLAQGQAEAFIRGELHAARLVTLDQAQKAVLASMDELKLEVRGVRHRDDAYIQGQAGDGPEFKVEIETKSPVVVKFEIRVGIMGDQAVSRLLMSRIDHHLGIRQPIVPVEESPVVAPPPTSQPE